MPAKSLQDAHARVRASYVSRSYGKQESKGTTYPTDVVISQSTTGEEAARACAGVHARARGIEANFQPTYPRPSYDELIEAHLAACEPRARARFVGTSCPQSEIDAHIAEQIDAVRCALKRHLVQQVVEARKAGRVYTNGQLQATLDMLRQMPLSQQVSRLAYAVSRHLPTPPGRLNPLYTDDTPVEQVRAYEERRRLRERLLNVG